MKHFDTIRADQWTKAFQREVDAGNCVVIVEAATKAYKAEDGEYDRYLYDSNQGGGEVWVNRSTPFKVFWRDTVATQDEKDERIAELQDLVQQYESIIESICNLTQGVVY